MKCDTCLPQILVDDDGWGILQNLQLLEISGASTYGPLSAAGLHALYLGLLFK